MFYDFSPFFVTGWRGKSEKNQKRQSKLGRKMPYRKCLIASQGPFLTAAENYIIIIIWVPPSLSTKECIELPRPSCWDLGPPRMEYILPTIIYKFSAEKNKTVVGESSRGLSHAVEKVNRHIGSGSTRTFFWTCFNQNKAGKSKAGGLHQDRQRRRRGKF